MPDRRIPPIGRRVNAPDAPDPGQHYPGFDHYLASACGRDDPWVLVADLPARNTPPGAENLLLWSALVPLDRVDDILVSYEWDARFDTAGYPSFVVEGRVIRFEEVTEGRTGIEIVPFSIYRSSHGYESAFFELLQPFVLYHSLVDRDGHTQFRIEEDGTFSDIVRLEHAGGRQRILIERGALLDYLSAHRRALVRYHDYRNPLPAGSPTGVHESLSGASTFHFRYQALAADLGIQTDLAYLHGKDVLCPPAFPMPEHLARAGVEQAPREYATFIYAVDGEGHAVEETSNGGLLSSYFRDRERTHFLTPIWFRSAVLDRYYADRRYEVDGSLLRCLDLWSLQFDRVSDEHVHVWLGDLGSIPLTEQRHWRSFNIRPPAGAAISNARYEADFAGNFAEPEHNPIYLFFRAFTSAQAAATDRDGTPLFRPLGVGDEHVAAGLRVPFSDDARAFDEQVLNLAKLTADSVDTELIQNVTQIRIDRVNGPHPFDVLESYLVARGMDAPAAAEAVGAFRAIQRLRSIGAAHRRAADYAERAARVINGAPSQRAFRGLLDNATRALEAITNTLSPA